MNEKRVLFSSYLKLFSLFLVILVAKSLYFHFFPERLFQAYYPKISYQKEVLSLNDLSYRTLILGDSLAVFNLNSNDISTETINLGLFGATYLESYWTLKRYLAQNQAPQEIILINAQNWEHKKEKEFWQYFVGLGFYSFQDREKIKTSDENLFHSLKWLYYRSGIPNYDLLQLKNSLWKGDEIAKNNLFMKSLLEKEKGSIVLEKRYPPNRPVIQPYHQQYFDGLTINSDNEYYLKEILKLAQQHKAKLVMIDPPIMPSYKNNPAILKFKNDFRNYHQKLIADFNFRYCNDEETPYEDSDFLDLNHLLLKGAKKYASFIKSCLNKD